MTLFGYELEPALDSLPDDLEKRHGGTRSKRAQFKAYVVLPNAGAK